MKTYGNDGWRLGLILAVCLGLSPARTSTAEISSPTDQNSPLVTPSEAYQVVERGLHGRTWQKRTPQIDPATGQTTLESHQFVELADGLCYEGDGGQLMDTKELFEAQPNGGWQARQGQHQVNLPADLQGGTVVLVMPDKQPMRARIFGLAYHSPSLDKSVLIAEIQSCAGQLVTPNQVLFRDAFVDVWADVRYVYKKNSFEQDIILRENIPAPSEYGLPDDVWLEIWSEVIEAPAISQVPRANPGENDAGAPLELSFPTMKFGRGKAFEAHGASSTPAATDSEGEVVEVHPNWVNAQGRTFIVESVSYGEVLPMLQKLPGGREAKLEVPKSKVVGKSVRKLPEMHAKAPERLYLASAKLDGKHGKRLVEGAERGVVLDYTVLNGSSYYPLSLDSGVTYWISGAYTLTGALTINEAAIVKVDPANGARMTSSGVVTCLATSTRMAVFTSRNDNSTGETLPGSTGNPTGSGWGYGGLAINGTSANLAHIRFSHIYVPFNANNISQMILRNVQFMDCGFAAGASSSQLAIYNGLFHQVTRAFSYSGGSKIIGQHLTVDQAGDFFYPTGSNPTPDLLNSLIVAVTNSLGFNPNDAAYASDRVLSSGAGVFESVLEGGHYLPADSPYKNAAIATVDATLLADLKKRTTDAPIPLTNTIILNMVLAPHAQRDTNTLDIGYHYEIADFLVGACALKADLTLTNGVVVGTFGTSGLRLQNGARLFSEGVPNRLNRLVRNAHLWQEQVQGVARIGQVTLTNECAAGQTAEA